MLGYRDSGMKGTEANTHPESFAMAPLDEAVEKLVRIIRAERPQVLITYGDDHRGYPHPDHIRTHDISVAAFDGAGDPERFPDAGPPFQPLKLYYTAGRGSGSRPSTTPSSPGARRARTPTGWPSGIPRRPTGR